MKRFSVLTLVLTMMLTVSACGAESTPLPTATPIDIQGTIVAAASTVIAETQAAIPTSTPTATPTNTPVVTATLPVMPTLGATFTASPVGSSGASDPCINQVLPATLKGNTIKIRIDNPTRAAIMVSVYLQQAAPQSVCGYRSYALDPQQSLVINDLVEGCYSIWAWNPDPKEYFMVTNGTSCLDTSDSWTFDISTSSIKLRK